MKVIQWWNLSSDESYLVMKVKIVKEVKRSDFLWRFACGDVFLQIDSIYLFGEDDDDAADDDDDEDNDYGDDDDDDDDGAELGQ